ncbi:MAG: hypothetical protein JWN73_3696 [Betaproteobacteria bacterium]|nr:hypothetical protein [Betaproteobacteria bacterium]
MRAVNFRRRLAIAFGSACVLASAWCCACQTVPVNYVKFDPKEFVLYGKVVGDVKLDEACIDTHDNPCAWGLRISIVDVVSSPAQPLKEVDVFLFGLSSMCQPTVMRREWIPVVPAGTKIAFVATALNGKSDRILLNRSDQPFLIFPADADLARLRHADLTFLDYRSVEGNRGPDFELRKNMADVELAQSDPDRIQALGHLARSIWMYASNDPFEEIARRYVNDEATIRRLVIEHREYLYNSMMMPIEAGGFEVERAASGSAEYQFYLGLMRFAEHRSSAIPLLRQASRQNFVAADYVLGMAYADASKESPSREARTKLKALSRTYFRRAVTHAKILASRGDGWAQVMIAARPESLVPFLEPMPPEARRRLLCKSINKVSARYWEIFASDEKSCLPSWRSDS